MKLSPATIIGAIVLAISCLPYIAPAIPTSLKDGAKTFQLRHIGSVDGKGFFAEKNLELDWWGARTFCWNSGMHLASITSVAQQNLLKYASSFTGNFWTGGRDSQTHAQFIWDFNKVPLSNTSTGPITSFFNIQTCVYYAAGNNRKLYSHACTTKLLILCEIIT